MTFIKYHVADNVQAQLSGNITAIQTSFAIKNGVNIPTVGNWIARLVQYSGGVVVKSEKILVTGVSGTTLTVTRGYSGSSATTFNEDDYLYLTVASEVIEDIQEEIERLESDKVSNTGDETISGVKSFSNRIEIANTTIGKGIYVNQTGNGIALDIYSESTGKQAVNIESDLSNLLLAEGIFKIKTNTKGLFVTQNYTLDDLTNTSFDPLRPVAEFNRGATNRGANIAIGNQEGYVNLFAYVGSGSCDFTIYGKKTANGDTNMGGFSFIDEVNQDSTLRIGSYYLWVDSTGDLRIKSTAPTSDTDGTVVGTQS